MSDKLELNIIYMDINDIIPYKNNAKLHPQHQIDQIKESIKEFGFNDPIAIDENNTVIEGHGRILAAKQLGIQEVPVIRLDHMTEEQRKAYIIAHNRLTMITGFDLETLYKELDSLDGDLQELTGFDDEEILKLFDDLYTSNISTRKEREIYELPERDIEIGDIFIFDDKHKVIVGDSTHKETYEKLLEGKTVQTVLADPPYGMNKSTVLNDDKKDEELLEFNKKWIELAFNVLDDNRGFYSFGMFSVLSDIYQEIIRKKEKENKALFRNMITWKISNPQGVNSEGIKLYPPYEKAIFFIKGKYNENANKDTLSPKIKEKIEILIGYFKDLIKKYNVSDEYLRETIPDGSLRHNFSVSQFYPISKKNFTKLFPGESYEFTAKLWNEIKDERIIGTSDFIHDNSMGYTEIWEVFREKGVDPLLRTHETPKPVDLLKIPILTSTRKDEIVFDPFLGTGSTLIASDTFGRICYGIELNPKYMNVIIERYKNFKTDSKKEFKIERIRNNTREEIK